MRTKRVAATVGATAALLGLLATASPAAASPATASQSSSPTVTAQSEYDDLTDGMIYTGTYETYAGCAARLWVYGLDPKRPYSARCVENSKGQWELWTMNQ